MNDLQETVWNSSHLWHNQDQLVVLHIPPPFHSIHMPSCCPIHIMIWKYVLRQWSLVTYSVGGRRSGVKNDDEDTTFLLKVLYCIVARESVPVPPKRTAIAWHPSSLHPLPGLVRWTHWHKTEGQSLFLQVSGEQSFSQHPKCVKSQPVIAWRNNNQEHMSCPKSSFRWLMSYSVKLSRDLDLSDLK